MQSVCFDAVLFGARAGARVWSAPFTWFEEKVEKHRYLYPELLRRKILYRTVFAWAVEQATQRYVATSAVTRPADERHEREPASAEMFGTREAL
jgi:hypothetical protein